MKIAIVTDAWSPQINGVVKTLEQTVRCLQAAGHEVLVIEPSRFRTIACPGYDEIRLSLLPYRTVRALLSGFAPDAIHVATEGPLGFAARRYALKHGLNFTTAYHTKFPEYLEARTGIPARCFYPAMRWFHHPAKAVMVSTDSVIAELQVKGFCNLVKWSRGVDMALFDAGLPRTGRDAADPVFLYVGRISVEKNLEAFLDLPLPGENGWSAMVLHWRHCPSAIRRRCSSARKPMRNLPKFTAWRMCSYSPAKPILSVWSCWKLWLPGFRWPPIRWLAPGMFLRAVRLRHCAATSWKPA